MQRKILLWFALALQGIFLGFGQIAFGVDLPPLDTPSKVQFIGGWSNVTIKLVVPGTSNPPVKCIIEEIPAKLAVCKVVPKPPPPYWEMFSILAVHDPHSKMNCLIAADHTFYATGKSGMTGFTAFTPGVRWSHSYLEVPEAAANLAAAIAKFEKEFDGRKLNESLLQERRDRVGLQKASPLFYFLEAPIGGSKPVELKVEAFGITDDILQLDVRNPATKAPATYWIDLADRKVIRAVVDGQEMNVDTQNQPWADPLK